MSSAPRSVNFTTWNTSGPTLPGSTGKRPSPPTPERAAAREFLMNVLQELRARFVSALSGLADDPATLAAMVKPAQDARFGDYQANCAMPLARQHGGGPNSRDGAAQIIPPLDFAALWEPPEIAGPGFINLRLRGPWLTQVANQLVADERLGVARANPPRHIVVDYSSPNVAKPMHV